MIFDISNISDPELIGEFTGSGKYSQSFVRGEHVYLAGEELEVVNTSNLNNIIEIAYDPYVGLATGIHVTDTHVYLTDYFGGLLILSWLKDSDNDLLSDEEELTLGEDGFITNPNNWDTDGDQLTDFQEMTYETDPTDEDSDDDELSDYEEIYTHDTDPLDSDSDDDNLSDYDEIFTHGTDPNDEDSDDDGFTDDEEIEAGSDPMDPSITPKAGLNVIMISLLGIASLLGLLVMRRRK
jgi:hypothetical protein